MFYNVPLPFAHPIPYQTVFRKTHHTQRLRQTQRLAITIDGTNNVHKVTVWHGSTFNDDLGGK